MPSSLASPSSISSDRHWSCAPSAISTTRVKHLHLPSRVRALPRLELSVALSPGGPSSSICAESVLRPSRSHGQAVRVTSHPHQEARSITSPSWTCVETPGNQGPRTTAPALSPPAHDCLLPVPPIVGVILRALSQRVVPVPITCSSI